MMETNVSTESTLVQLENILLSISNLSITPNNRSVVNVNESKESGLILDSLPAILVPVFFSLIFVVGVIGNGLVITVLIRMSKRQQHGLSITYCYILNLAIADSLFLFLCVPFQATVYSMPSWPFGEIVCHGSEFFQKTAMLASIYTMVALSFDRFYAIVLAKSASQGRTNKNWAYLVLVVIWFIAVVFGILSIFTRRHIVYGGIPICMLNIEMPNYYLGMVVSTFVLGYVAPLLVIFACYFGVVIAMTKNAQTGAARQNKSTQVIKKHVTKVVIMVVIFFALDWFLHHMLILWMEFGDFPFTSATLALKIIGHCLSYANSSVNPLIYAFVSNQFRKDFRSLCPCRKLSRVIGNVRMRSRNFVTVIHDHFQTERSNGNSDRSNASRSESNVWEAPPAKVTTDSAENSNTTGMTNLTPVLGPNLKSSTNLLPQTSANFHETDYEKTPKNRDSEVRLLLDASKTLNSCFEHPTTWSDSTPQSPQRDRIDHHHQPEPSTHLLMCNSHSDCLPRKTSEDYDPKTLIVKSETYSFPGDHQLIKLDILQTQTTREVASKSTSYEDLLRNEAQSFL